MKKQVLLLIVTLLTSALTFAAPTLSDNEAQRLLVEEFNKSRDRIKLRALTVGSPRGENAISSEKYKEYQAWEKIGVITISVDRDYKAFTEGKTFNWKDYETNLGGVQGKIVVKKTDKGARLAEAGNIPQVDGWLALKDGVFKVQKIVAQRGFV